MTVNSEQLRAFRSDLLEWYRSSARDLPWRATSDAYKIWISEIMLQQTRVDQAIPYFERFISKFPDVKSLADADLQEVLVAWEGLGYYSRARNLHRAARQIVDRFSGRLPTKSDELRELTGVGAYTSAAVASIAFGESAAAIDGNVTRVVARVFGIEDNVKSTRVKNRIGEIAASIIDPLNPGDFNQAMMELGATVCTPKKPKCPSCPLSEICEAYVADVTDLIPYSAKTKPTPHFEVAVGIVRDDRQNVLLVKRDDEGLLGGLWEFPGSKVDNDETPEEACQRAIRIKVGIEVEPIDRLITFKHQYSHFGITVQAFECVLLSEPEAAEGRAFCEWVPVGSLGELPMHRSARKVADVASTMTRQRG